VDELDKEVREYFGERESGTRTIPGYVLDINDIVPDFVADIREVSEEEISLALGDAALTLGELEEAKRWFTIASADPELRAEAEAGIGDTYKFQDDFETALPYFERSIELAPDSPYIQLDYAEYWHDRADATEDADERQAYIKTARKHYVNAWKLDNTMPETYAMYGRTFLLDDNNPDKAVEMLLQAEALLPSHIGVRIWLAEAYAATGDQKSAADEARSVLAWSHEESEAAKTANEIIEAYEENIEYASQSE
jgi:tetratricopeptide (TPR) repeat protein